jgi:hypothetical protein
VVDRDGVGAAVVRQRLTVGVVRGGAGARLDGVEAGVRVLVDGRDDLADERVGAEPVALAVQVPLRDFTSGQRELDDRGGQVTVR